MSIPPGTPDERILHVTPINDLREHSCNEMECWCRPTLLEEENYIVVHNSMDQREKYETGERKPS